MTPKIDPHSSFYIPLKSADDGDKGSSGGESSDAAKDMVQIPYDA